LGINISFEIYICVLRLTRGPLGSAGSSILSSSRFDDQSSSKFNWISSFWLSIPSGRWRIDQSTSSPPVNAHFPFFPIFPGDRAFFRSDILGHPARSRAVWAVNPGNHDPAASPHRPGELTLKEEVQEMATREQNPMMLPLCFCCPSSKSCCGCQGRFWRRFR
jgi:hypothetical protein